LRASPGLPRETKEFKRIMSKLKAFAVSTIIGVSALSMIVAPASASAWHPEGKIVKKVQNMTQKGELSDANDEKSAVSAKPGDILTYVITVSNEQTNDDGKNDMVNTVLTDTLPAGVELVSNPSSRAISENLGTIKPKQSVTKQYQVKVTSDKDGDVINNKACFTGNTAVNDNPQQGCEVAVVKVSNPKVETPTPPTPPVTTTPETPKTPQTPVAPAPAATAEALPSTGPASTIAIAVLAVAAGYVARLKFLARQEN